MCDETKTECMGVSAEPTIPKNDTLYCLTRTMNHLTAIRTTPLQKNEYTPMPSTNALIMDEPSTSCYPPQFVEYVESIRKPRSKSDVTLYTKRKEQDPKCEHQMSKDGSVVRTLPVVPPFLTSKCKIDLSRRVGGATVRISQLQTDDRYRRKRSLSAGSLSLEKLRKHDHKQFRNALHSSFGDADLSRLAVRNNDVTPTLTMGVCPECHRCRCIQCARPRHLPSQWICGDTCLLSSGCVVDSLSCMCCVKAVRYHCRCFETCFTLDEHPSKIDEKAAWRRRKMADLMCVLLASICLPCLCCYLPLKGCEAAAEGLYCAWNDRSCHCDYRSTQSTTTITEQPKTVARSLQKQRIAC
uniref:Protein sprouty n=1 Tax=Ascaris suum TaxID=6253 RepID=F1L912_ASCSU